MKITPKQFMYLLITLRDSVETMSNLPDFTFNKIDRTKVFNSIITQEYDEPIIICNPREKRE